MGSRVTGAPTSPSATKCLALMLQCRRWSVGLKTGDIQVLDMTLTAASIRERDKMEAIEISGQPLSFYNPITPFLESGMVCSVDASIVGQVRPNFPKRSQDPVARSGRVALAAEMANE